MVIFLIMEALAGLSLWRWLKGRTERSKLRSWADTPSVPLFSGLIERASGGEIASRPKALAAGLFKSAVRKYVNSDLFDHAVNGMVNRENALKSLSRRLANRFNSRENPDLFSGDGPVSEAFQ